MPPQIPRPALTGVLSSTSCLRASTSTTVPASVTWSTRRQQRATASPFSTTSLAAHLPTPPESPKFIRVPAPPQSSEERQAPIRGHLPVPRDVFPKHGGSLKMKKGYVEAATPLSASELAGLPPKSESEALHRVEAATRREAFAAGLQGLWERKREATTKKKLTRAIRLSTNRKAARAAERADELLTRSTFGPPGLLNTAVELDPLRFERAEEARKKHEAIAAKKAEARKDALTQLYIAAGDFITDEQELEQRVNDIFREKAFKSPSGILGRADSIWDEGELPISIAQVKVEMFTGSLDGELSGLAGLPKSESEKTVERQKKIAEELTGGKL